MGQLSADVLKFLKNRENPQRLQLKPVVVITLGSFQKIRIQTSIKLYFMYCVLLILLFLALFF